MIKLIGLGPRRYARDPFNIFDAVVVILALLDFVLIRSYSTDSKTDGGISAFRVIRLLRIFKLARSWTTLRELLRRIAMTAREVAIFMVLLLLCMFVFALLGMEMFGHKVQFDENNNILTKSSEL